MIRVVIFILVFLPSVLFSQDGWMLEKNKNEIRVYTRTVQGSSYKEFRGVMEIDAPLSSVVAVLQDVDHMCDWMYRAGDVKLLEREGDSIIILHGITTAPWPFADRDQTYKYQYIWNEVDSTVIVKMMGMSDYFPENENCVRMPDSKGSWQFKQRKNNMVQVSLQYHADPGGKIPAWLSNSFVVDSPYETLKAMKKMIRKEEYQNCSFDFLIGDD